MLHHPMTNSCLTSAESDFTDSKCLDDKRVELIETLVTERVI